VTVRSLPALAADARPRRRRRWSSSLAGWGYAAPTAAFVLIFFVVPIGIVARMSVSDWKLFTGDRGWNSGKNFRSALDDPLLWPSVWALLLVPVGIALLLWGAITPEEKYLSSKFGAEYDAYRQRVRRWL